MQISSNEYAVMEIIWANGGKIQAKEIAGILHRGSAISGTAVYATIGRLIDKKIISRADPDFICTSLITKDDVQKEATADFVEKYFENSFYDMITYAESVGRLSPREREKLSRLFKADGSK